MKPDFQLPPLARFAGAFLLASSFFAVAAIVAWGTYDSRSPLALALAVGGLVCLALWLWGRAQGKRFVDEAPRDGFAKQRALLGVNALSSVFLVAVLLVGLNYIASRRHKTFDLTQGRVNSLAPQTINALEKLPSPVKMTFYYLQRQPAANVQALLQNYARASDKVKVEFVSAPSNPVGLPQSLISSGQPVLVVQRETTDKAAAKQEVSVVDEQNVTSALLKLQNSKAQPLAWLSGHGELGLERLTGLRSALESQNYTLRPASLLAKNSKIPADIAALIIAAPATDLSVDEAKSLQNYLNSKGRLMVLLTPTRAPTPRLDALLRSFGTQKGAGLVVDEQPGNFYQTPQIPVGVRGDGTRHPILRGTSADVLFPGALALQSVAPAPSEVKVTSLFQTSQAARVVNAQSGQPLPGRAPFDLALASEKRGARMLILSSAALATDQALALFGNQSFLLSGIGWTVGNDALVSIPPKPPVSNTLDMPTPVRAFASLLSWLVLPFLALVTGAAVWWRRR